MNELFEHCHALQTSLTTFLLTHYKQVHFGDVTYQLSTLPHSYAWPPYFDAHAAIWHRQRLITIKDVGEISAHSYLRIDDHCLEFFTPQPLGEWLWKHPHSRLRLAATCRQRLFFVRKAVLMVVEEF